MPRNFYETVIGAPDISGSLKVYSAMRISVFQRGTAVLASIYQRETGSTQGPSPEAGASGGPNPFVTGASGSVQFWADIGRYDVLIEDTQTPVRIGSRTIQWNSVPLDEIPGANLADAGVGTAKLADLAVTTGKIAELAVTAGKHGDLSVEARAVAADLLDLFVPIGSMVDYGGTVDPPQTAASRWVITDGRSLSQATYATCFARLGNAWDTFDGQAAPGAGLFRIPKTGPRVAVPAGAATGLTTRARAQSGGAEGVTLSGLQSGVNPNGSTGGMSANANKGYNTLASMVPQGAAIGVSYQEDQNHIHYLTGRAADASHENMPPWVCLGPKIIRIA